MTHNFVIPEQVLQTALELLKDDLMVAATFNRDYEDNVGGGRGTVDNVRVPAVLKARRRALSEAGTAIQTDTLSESTVPVRLTDMIYSAVDVTDEDLTLNIADFTRQVIMPQVEAMVEDIEDFAVATAQGLAEETTIDYNPADPVPTFTAARKMLRDRGVSAQNLFALCGTDVYRNLLNARAISDASQSGSAEALREGRVPRVSGFTVIENNRIAENEIIWYSRDSFTLAIRAPRVPDGVTRGESRAANGFALRWVVDYDSNVLANRSIFSTFIGCTKIDHPRRTPDGDIEMVTPAIRALVTTEPESESE